MITSRYIYITFSFRFVNVISGQQTEKTRQTNKTIKYCCPVVRGMSSHWLDKNVSAEPNNGKILIYLL